MTEEQKQQVARWIAEGEKLSGVQRRLDEELGVRLTYMETRLLIDDLQLTPQDAPEATPPIAQSPVTPPSASVADSDAAAPLDRPASTTGNVVVNVDQVTRPGALVSGSVLFADGVQALWHLDQTGRLGMQPEQAGYQPTKEGFAEFQSALERELVKLGL